MAVTIFKHLLLAGIICTGNARQRKYSDSSKGPAESNVNSAGDRNYINSKDLYCGGEATSTWAAGTVKDAMEHCDQTPGCVAIAYNKQRRNYRGMTSLTTSYHDAGFDCYSVEGWLQTAYSKPTEGGIKEVNLLVVGKTGVGKSRLTNALLGKDMAREGHTDVTTKDADVFSLDVNGVRINIWDTPGLFDHQDTYAKYLQMIQMKVKHVDGIIYCTKMDDARVREEDRHAIELLTNAFGVGLWERGVLVLTFANKVTDPENGDVVTPDFFQQVMDTKADQYRGLIKEAMNKNADMGTNKGMIAMNVPVIPAGNTKTSPTLVTGVKWLPELWTSLFEKIDPSAQPAMITINWERLKQSDFLGSEHVSRVVSAAIGDLDEERSSRRRGGAAIRKGGCFAAHSTIKVLGVNGDWEVREVGEVKSGDMVASVTRDGHLTTSEVVLSYRHKELREVVSLNVTTTAGQMLNLQLTDNHLLATSSAGLAPFSRHKMMPAKRLHTGSHVFVVGAGGGAEAVVVTSVGRAVSQVQYVLTWNDRVVVNSVVASSHNINHWLGKVEGAPLKLLYKLSPRLLRGRWLDGIADQYEQRVMPHTAALMDAFLGSVGKVF